MIQTGLSEGMKLVTGMVGPGLTAVPGVSSRATPRNRSLTGHILTKHLQGAESRTGITLASVDCYDRDGNPISLAEWGALRDDPEYRTLARDEPDGYLVSTVWLGLDHGWGLGIPVIFETMVFAPATPESRARESRWYGEPSESEYDFDGIYQDRYATEAGALAGHDQALRWLQDYITSQALLTESGLRELPEA
jgi:hypothetical protein